MVDFLDEVGETEYHVTFYPAIGVVKIHSSRKDCPPISISYDAFANKGNTINFAKNSPMGRIIKGAIEAWNGILEEERAAFYNTMPLTCLVTGVFG